MKKSLVLLSAAVLFSMFQFNVAAQSKRHNGEESRSLQGEIEFKIGDTVIKIGGPEKTYDGKNIRELEQRLRRLERAVTFLMQNAGYHETKASVTRWECSLETSFDGTFIARTDSQKSAEAKVINDCMRKSRSSIFCDSDNVDCKKLGD